MTNEKTLVESYAKKLSEIQDYIGSSKVQIVLNDENLDHGWAPSNATKKEVTIFTK